MVTIIINPIAGGQPPGVGQTLAQTASAALAAEREDVEVFVTERRGHARELARGARTRGARLVVAWGGDGTVNEVASELAFGQTPLAIVPAGSGNGLARDLGVARRPERALREAFAAASRSIDVGELDGRLFFSIAGVGFDAHIARCFDRSALNRGLTNYLRLSARELLTYQTGAYRIDHAASPLVPGTPLDARDRASKQSSPTRRALLVTIANSSQFGNGARIAPSARVDDGVLDLVVFEEVSRFATFCALPRLFTGGVAGARGFSMQQIEQATIESDEAMIYHVDGEPFADGTRLEARVHPASLQVCVR